MKAPIFAFYPFLQKGKGEHKVELHVLFGVSADVPFTFSFLNDLFEEMVLVFFIFSGPGAAVEITLDCQRPDGLRTCRNGHMAIGLEKLKTISG